MAAASSSGLPPDWAWESTCNGQASAGALLSVLGPPDPIPSQSPDILSPPLPSLRRAPDDSIFSDRPRTPSAPRLSLFLFPFRAVLPQSSRVQKRTARVTFPKSKSLGWGSAVRLQPQLI